MTFEEYKKSKNGHTTMKNIKKAFVRIFICGILVLGIMIVCNLSDTTRELLKKEIFENTFDFTFVNKAYSKLFKTNDTEPVSLNNNFEYINIEDYLDGASLTKNEGEIVSLIDSGIVVYIGEKEGYGQTVIVQQSNGIDVWYGNINDLSINLYDYVNKGTKIATSNDKLYLAFQKNGEFLDYKNYIK